MSDEKTAQGMLDMLDALFAPGYVDFRQEAAVLMLGLVQQITNDGLYTLPAIEHVGDQGAPDLVICAPDRGVVARWTEAGVSLVLRYATLPGLPTFLGIGDREPVRVPHTVAVAAIRRILKEQGVTTARETIAAASALDWTAPPPGRFETVKVLLDVLQELCEDPVCLQDCYGIDIQRENKHGKDAPLDVALQAWSKAGYPR